jgi:hypothetical protein
MSQEPNIGDCQERAQAPFDLVLCIHDATVASGGELIQRKLWVKGQH